MAASLNTPYVPHQVTITWLGIKFEALADQFVSVQYDNPHITQDQGPDQKVHRTVNHNTTGTFEVTLNQNSANHKALLAVLLTQQANGAVANGTFVMTDPSGAALYTGLNTCISNAPNNVLGSTHQDGDMTWTFSAAELIPA